MDAETARLLITAGTAIVAGLGGAGLTALINRRNTIDTLTSARNTNEDQWRRTHDREHFVWLRDTRQESYVAFHDEADKLAAKLIEWNREEGVPNEALQKLSTLRSRIKLVGSPTVRIQARDLELLLGQALVLKGRMYELDKRPSTSRNANDDRRQFRETAARLKELRAKIVRALIDFVLAVRAELGTATDQDHELNAALQTMAIADDDSTASPPKAPER